MKKFGYVRQDELGNTYYTEDAERFGKLIFDTIHQCMDDFKKENNIDYKLNCE